MSSRRRLIALVGLALLLPTFVSHYPERLFGYGTNNNGLRIQHSFIGCRPSPVSLRRWVNDIPGRLCNGRYSDTSIYSRERRPWTHPQDRIV